MGRCFYDLIWATEAELLREHVALLIERRVEGLAEHRMPDGRGESTGWPGPAPAESGVSDADSASAHLVGRDMTGASPARIAPERPPRKQRYRGLFENLQSGFALNEVILDDAGRVG